MTGTSSPFSVSIVTTGTSATVALRGELDINSAADLDAALDSLINAGPKETVFDLSELTFVDSSGIAALISMQKQLSEQGRHLIIHSPRPFVAKVLEITDLTAYLNVHTDA